MALLACQTTWLRALPAHFSSLSGLFGFEAAGGGEVLCAEADADFFEEGGGRLAAGEDPNIIVGKFLGLAIYRQDHGTLGEFHGVGVEDDFDFALAGGFLDALRV